MITKEEQDKFDLQQSRSDVVSWDKTVEEFVTEYPKDAIIKEGMAQDLVQGALMEKIDKQKPVANETAEQKKERVLYDKERNVVNVAKILMDGWVPESYIQELIDFGIKGQEVLYMDKEWVEELLEDRRWVSDIFGEVDVQKDWSVWNVEVELKDTLAKKETAHEYNKKARDEGREDWRIAFRKDILKLYDEKRDGDKIKKAEDTLANVKEVLPVNKEYSIVDYLNTADLPFDQESRRNLALALGIEEYNYTWPQNLWILSKIMGMDKEKVMEMLNW